MIWKLDRPKPALPSSYFWTWDHSTNWVLDDPGIQNERCQNKYLKRPETFLSDYRQLTDLAAGLGVKGVLIWGFLRDSHGGVENAKRVADYAASKGIAMMPGIGTTGYGGVYYEGDDKYNLETFMKKNPDVRLTRSDGSRDVHTSGGFEARYACPLHPQFREWLAGGMQWLFREFAIGGANLENGDLMVCHCERCKEHRKNWPASDPDFFRMQGLSYEPALKSIEPLLSKQLVTWAAYSGFLPGDGPRAKLGDIVFMGCQEPALIKRLPQEAIGQWTLTWMVREHPLPLTGYLDHGAPKEVFDNPSWPEGLRAPGKRSVGFLHQGSQSFHERRYDQVVSAIKEGCLRAYRSGLEGVSIHGEVTSRHIPSALNYLAFSHFIHYPEDTLREFGRKTLGQVLGSEKEGERFAEVFAHWDAGTLTDALKKEAGSKAVRLGIRVAQTGEDFTRSRFWNWLGRSVYPQTYLESHTQSFY